MEDGDPKALVSATETEHQVQSALLLDVVIGERTSIFQLLTSEDETLLVRGNALLILNLSLDVINGIRALHLQRNRLAGKSLHEDLHTTTETKDKVKSGFFLDVVVGQGTAILQLLTSEDQTLLVRGNALLVLNLGLHIVDGVRRLHLKGDGLSGQGLDD
ncbi:hypothetical protein CBS115988_10848 [Aspergillus niger]|nr:hypothetical protein CBS115988_10848 [Aspergillus niger]